jgi:hypothetical protein
MASERIEELRKRHDRMWNKKPLEEHEVDELFSHIDALEARARMDDDREWRITEWTWGKHFDSDEPTVVVTITRMKSPFYKGNRYAVRKGGSCLTIDGKWEYEPQPSSRTQEFYDRCRFILLADAMTAARRAAMGGGV